MAKNLNEEYRVSMKFDADTKAALQQIESLFKTLNKISTSAPKTFDITEFLKAAEAAENLKKHLNAAVNTNTGKLDLSKFSQSLSKSNLSLNDIYKSLHSIGPEGQKAFLQLAASITNADNSTFTLNKKIKELGVTLKNTVKWQISSSMIHGFMGAILSAYGYALNLNKSLNNIRIVTGLNIDLMEKFAATANKAAKALSTSTLNYTDAALIYYQLGLSDKEVKARTDVTVKMANVTGDTAEKVSQLLTAVWNNFAKGSLNLEYFADVMTALGAATASSTDEISEGLEKFSAIAQTVGLSYEYATAALATVTATTRESASVVGNAFKTLFARLEGLKLGETLDDGTDLNKYSLALATIGVNIKDASGLLRAMDDILDDMAKRWGTLDKATQMATAQTVGGVRQYNTLIALMENWDFMLENLNTARNATGELLKLADIYAQSWEAALKRVKASLEDIYTTIIDDKAFIGLTDTLAGVVNVIGNVIEGLGGVKGLLLLIGSIVMNTYAKELPTILSNIASNINVLTGAAERNKLNTLLSLNKIILNNNINNSSNASLAEILSLKTVTLMTMELNEKRKLLSLTEIAAYESKIKMILAYGRSTTAIGKEIDALEKENRMLERSIISTLRKKSNWDPNILELINSKQAELETLQTQNLELGRTKSGFNRTIASLTSKLSSSGLNAEENQKLFGTITKLTSVQTAIDKNKVKISELKEEIKDLNNILTKNEYSGKNLLVQLKLLSEAFVKTNIEINKATDYTKKWQQAFEEANDDPEKIKKIENAIKDYLAELKKVGIDTSEFFDENNNLKNFDEIKLLFENITDIATKAGESYLLQYDNIEKTGEALIRLGANREEVELFIKDFHEAGVMTDELKNRLKELAILSQSTVLHTIVLSEGIALMASTLSLVAMGLNSIKNLGNILNNLDITNGEKLLLIMTSLGMVLPIITSLLNKEKLANLSATAAKILHMNATASEAAAEKLLIPIKYASGEASYFALGPLLIFVGIAAAVIGAIIAITNALGKLQDRLKTLKQSLEDFNEATNEAIDSWNELKATITDYESAYNAIANLKEGTQEFVDTIKSANEQANRLITDLGLVFGQGYIFDSNGAITFTDIGLQKINEANEKGKRLSAYSAYTNAYNQLHIAEEEYNRELNTLNGIYSEASAIWSEYQEAATGKFLQEIGLRSAEQISELLLAKQNSPGELSTIGLLKQYGYILDDAEKMNEVAAIIDLLYAHPVISEAPLGYRAYLAYARNYGNLNAAILLGAGLSNNILALLYMTNQNITDGDIKEYQNKHWILEDLAKNELANLGITEDLINAIVGLGKAFAGPSEYLAFLLLMNEYESSAIEATEKAEKLLSGNKDLKFFTYLLGGHLEKILPEDIERLDKFDENSVLGLAFKVLFPGQDFNKFKQNASESYNIIDVYRNLLLGIQSIQESIKELNKAFGSLKFGDTVESIEGLSEEAASYFTVMADGTYKLTGSAEDFLKALLEQERLGFRNNIANAEEILKTDWANESAELAISVNRYGLAMTATDIEDLNQLLHEGEIELDHYTAAWGLLEQERDLKGLDTELLSDYTEYLQEVEGLSEEAADTVARSAMKMAKGTESLSKNFESWSDVLVTADARSEEYYKSLIGLRTAVADLLDISEDHLSEEFLKTADNMLLMQKAAEGDKEAIESLRTNLSDALFKQYTSNVDYSQFEKNFFDNLLNNYRSAQEEILNSPVGASLDLTDYINLLNQMVALGKLTVDLVNGMLDAMGVDPKYEVQEVTLPRTITTTTRHLLVISHNTNPPSYDIIETATSSSLVDNSEKTSAFGISYGKGKKPLITGVVKKANSSYAPPITPKNNGGSGNKSSSAKKGSEIERYHEVKSIIKDLTKEYERLDKAKERAFGKGKIDYLNQEIALYDQLVKADERYLAEARGWLEVDREKANAAARAMGFGEFNDLTNWTDILYALANYYNKNIDSEEAQKQYEQWTKDILQYIDTYDIVKEREDLWILHLNEIQDMIFERWNQKIELKMDIDERSRKLIDLKLKALGDSFYKRVEAAWLMLEQLGLANAGHMDITKATGDYKFLEDAFNEAKGLNLSPELQAEAYGLVFDKATEAASALLDMRQLMLEYYGETISLMREEWEKGDTQFGHLMTTLEHYDKLLDLTGQGKDYDKRLTILKGELEVSKNLLNVHQSELQMMQQQEEEMQRQYLLALNTGDEYAIEFAKRNLEVALDTVRELTETVLQDIEKIAEEAKEVLTTSLEKIYSEYEKKLTLGVGFDYLNQIMDLQAEKADLVLTETNKIYETNKLMNMLDRDMDKTSNTMFKNRLNNFKQEIKVMQERGELTHFELEDALLRYEVLKAQIALEDAQNAKSTVRLLRDSEGNFGYVYTGDREKMSEAQDNLDKANNDRYNHALEALEKFLREYYNKLQEFLNAMNELDEQRLAGAITEEEYLRRKLELINYYTPILETLEHDHLSAILVMNETSATHANDSWTLTLIGEGYGLKGKTLEWRDASVKLVDEVGLEFTTWKDNIDLIVEPEVTTDLDAMRDAVLEITDKATALNNYITETLLPTLGAELLETDALTQEFIELSKSISGLIELYKQLAEKASSAIDEISEKLGNLPDEKTITIREVYIPAGTSGSGSAGGTVIKTDTKDLDDIVVDGKDIEIEGPPNYNRIPISGSYSFPHDATDSYIKNQLIKLLRADNPILAEGTGWHAYWKNVKLFNSGGYTGEWGPSGKLAFLHQKELVLNADDTKNFLNGIYMLRLITDMIDLHAAAMGTADAWVNAMSPAGNRNLDQNVTIHAEFPNVTQHNEIELAFADLINRASQYVNRY